MDLIRLVDGSIIKTKVDTLNFDLTTDVLVVGAGCAGIYAAQSASSEGAKTTLIEEIGGKDSYELLENITECENYCHGASRKGANGAKAKLEYIKDAASQGTEVIIASAKYSIKDILDEKVKATRIRVK